MQFSTDGETIGFSAVDKHRITRGQGVALPDKVTLKISYGSEDDADGGPDFPDDTDEVMDDAEGHLEKFKREGSAVRYNYGLQSSGNISTLVHGK